MVLTAKQQEIHLVVDDKLLDVCQRDNHVRVAAELFSLCLNVSKGARHGQTTGEYAMRSVNDVWIVLTLLFARVAYDC